MERKEQACAKELGIWMEEIGYNNRFISFEEVIVEA